MKLNIPKCHWNPCTQIWLFRDLPCALSTCGFPTPESHDLSSHSCGEPFVNFTFPQGGAKEGKTCKSRKESSSIVEYTATLAASRLLHSRWLVKLWGAFAVLKVVKLQNPGLPRRPLSALALPRLLLSGPTLACHCRAMAHPAVEGWKLRLCARRTCRRRSDVNNVNNWQLLTVYF